MPEYLHALNDAKTLFELLAEEKGLPAAVVEKDYWTPDPRKSDSLKVEGRFLNPLVEGCSWSGWVLYGQGGSVSRFHARSL